MPEQFEHRALGLQETDRPLVYTAMSKHIFYMLWHISKHVLDEGGVPLNPFMTFGYFMLDTVDRDVVRQANNTLVSRADELWMYGDVSDGALAEIVQARKLGKPVRYFVVVKSKDIVECDAANVVLEEGLESHRHLL